MLGNYFYQNKQLKKFIVISLVRYFSSQIVMATAVGGFHEPTFSFHNEQRNIPVRNTADVFMAPEI